MRWITALIVSVLIVPTASFAAVTFSDDFESYSNGVNVNGLNNGSGFSAAWAETSAGKYVTNSTITHGGSRAVKYTHDATEPHFSRTFTGATTGTFSVYMYKTTTGTDICQVGIQEGSTFLGSIYFLTTGQIAILSAGAVFNNIQAYSANTWYKITIDWDTSTDMYRASVDGGAYTSFNAFAALATNVDKIDMQKQNTAATADCYWDDFSTTFAIATTTTPPDNIPFWW